MNIGIDIMGSDSSPYTLFEGIYRFAESSSFLINFSIYASQKVVENLIFNFPNSSAKKITFYPTVNAVSMDEDPFNIALKGDDTSMIKGLKALNDGFIDAFVTAGNTGALMIASKHHLSMISPIKRPALLALFPSIFSKGFAILDVGANLSAKAEYLVQHAAIGIIHQKVVKEVEFPRVALLNVGKEPFKGSIEQRKVFNTLKKMASSGHFTFVGNIEANDLFKKEIDVLVTDGFSGNVLLKTAEGTVDYIFQRIEKNIFCEKKFLNYEKSQFKDANYYAAVLVGVKGIVIKCHGDASIDSFYYGIQRAIDLIQKKFVKSLSSITQILPLESNL